MLIYSINYHQCSIASCLLTIPEYETAEEFSIKAYDSGVIAYVLFRAIITCSLVQELLTCL